MKKTYRIEKQTVYGEDFYQVVIFKDGRAVDATTKRTREAAERWATGQSVFEGVDLNPISLMQLAEAS